MPQKVIHAAVSRTIFGLCLLAVQGCSTVSPQVLHRLDRSVGQVIIVHPLKEGSSQAFLSAWQRGATDWRRLYFVSVVIGKNGLAPAGMKREGDGKTPSGIYPLGPAFGYAPSIDTGLEYRQAGENDFWVDDPQSMQYNQWVRGTIKARSFERLRRPDNLYRYGIVIGYNMHPVVPGAGSAIFMHVWRRYDAPTSGCVALGQRNLRKILHWLNRDNRPVIVLE